MRKFGQVVPGTHDWVVARHPEARVAVSRSSLEMLQAENAMLHEVLQAAIGVAGITAWAGEKMAHLRLTIARYEGWTEDPEVRDELVEKLLAIAEDLDDGSTHP